MTRKTNAELKRTARWAEIVSSYQRKHRLWVMTHMPSMSEAHWKLYETWVAGFGAMCMDQACRNSRKMRRRLKAARVTATVALRGWHQDAAQPPGPMPNTSHQADAMAYMTKTLQHKKMRFAMGGETKDRFAVLAGPYGGGKDRFAVLAREAGAAKKGRATRRK